MSKASETRAVNRLTRARENYAAVTAKYTGWVGAGRQNSQQELEIRAAFNELQNAQGPFYLGKYAWPA
jgi:hypothetical protein